MRQRNPGVAHKPRHISVFPANSARAAPRGCPLGRFPTILLKSAQQLGQTEPPPSQERANVKQQFVAKHFPKAAFALLVFFAPPLAQAQTALLAAPGASPGQARVPESKPAAIKSPTDAHHFWDKENDWLFAGVGASRTLDYFSTLNFRRRGRQEALLTNDLVDNHAAFAAVEAGGTGLSIGVSYIFHHYNHHQLERWTSIVHIGLATGGAIRNWSLKTAHPDTSSNQILVLSRR
jgi:hypothetical protein